MLSIPLWSPHLYYEAFALNRIQGRTAALRTAGMGKFTYHAAWDLAATIAMSGCEVIVLIVAIIGGFSFTTLTAFPFQLISCALAGLQTATLVDVLQNAAKSRQEFQ